jgi:hypothetical protein
MCEVKCAISFSENSLNKLNTWDPLLFTGRFAALSISDDPSRVFRAFLRDFQERRYLGKESFHVWPQAHKIDAVPKRCSFSFIGRTEEMREAMEALFPSGKLPPHEHNATEKPVQDRHP